MGVDRQKRSPDFLQWTRDPENREEIIALYLTAKEFGQRPSYYVFGSNLPLQSQYEIDFYILAIGKDYEAELMHEAEQRATSGRW